MWPFPRQIRAWIADALRELQASPPA